MMMVYREITNTDVLVFNSVFKAKRPLPIRKIASRVNMSWPTIKKTVEKLVGLGVLKREKSVRRTNVSIDDDFLKKSILPKLKENKK